MNVTARTHGFSLTGAIDAFVDSKMSAALHRFADHVVAVDVFLSDVNGPKGGVDKQVVVRIRMRHRQTLAVESTRADLYAAVAVSARRAKRALRRTVRRMRRIERRRLRQLHNAQPGASVPYPRAT